MMRYRSGRRRAAALVMATGLAAGLAAANGVGPFSMLHHAASPRLVARVEHHEPLIASDLYPAPTMPTPIVQTVVVQDPPPPPPAPARAASGSAAPRPEPTPGPEPTQSAPAGYCDDGWCAAPGQTSNQAQGSDD
jgi:hypothetical protein